MPVTSEYRQTGTIARIVDTNLNAWQDFAGQDINVPVAYQALDTSNGETDQAYWAYRGQAAMVQLADGSIVRVRNGDPTDITLRDIQIQVITDPTDVTQWTTWADKGWGTNYCVAIERDDSDSDGYKIYHAKADGLYMDNAKINLTVYDTFGIPGVLQLNPIIRIKPVFGQTHMLYVETLGTGADTNREVKWFQIPSTTSSPRANIDCAQWHHYHHDMIAAFDGSTGYRLRAMPLNDAERNLYASDTLTIETAPTADSTDVFGAWNDYNNVVYLKGPSKSAGFSRIDDLYLTQLTDPEYGAGTWYLFYTERHLDQFGNTLSNLKSPVFWSRAPQGPTLPSQPTPIGFSIWGFAGVAEIGGYVYLAGNGRVLRRLQQSTVIDITNYVLNGNYDLPRDNAAGQLSMECANPQNVLGAQLNMTSDTESGLTDRALDVGIGVKLQGESAYTFKRDAHWSVSALRKVRDQSTGAVQHLIVEGGDFWHRMANQFRDVWSIPGRFDRTDWQPDAINDISQYTNAHDEIILFNPAGADADTVPRLHTTSTNQFCTGTALAGTVTLYAGWRGANASTAQATFWGPAGGIVFRYVDEQNFSIVTCDSTGMYVRRIVDGTVNPVADFSDTADNAKMPASGGTLKIDFRWWRLRVYLNDDLIIDMAWSAWGPLNGFVGFWAPTVIEVSNVILQEPIATVTTIDLIQMLLAYIDEHHIQFEEDETTLNAPQYDLLFGPQSDLNTPEKAMRQVLESSNLNIVWRQDP